LKSEKKKLEEALGGLKREREEPRGKKKEEKKKTISNIQSGIAKKKSMRHR